MGDASLAALGGRWLDWTVTKALPLWTTRGFDEKRGLFEEQLDLTGAPVRDIPLRLMVQCRQIACLCLAEDQGWLPGGRQQAGLAASKVIQLFHAADDRPGWVFSIDRQGQPLRCDRDLYAHAFVLFAFAFLSRHHPAAWIDEIIQVTLSFIDTHLADRCHGAYRNSLPRSDEPRRQDPNMHLLEAFLALYETSGDAGHLARATALRDHALKHFIDPRSGMLHEEFAEDWRRPADCNRIEPGHHFEWAWLLRRYDALALTAGDATAENLADTAIRYGADPETGRIVDEIGADGAPVKRSSRLWPHAEALRGCRDGDRDGFRAKLIERLLTHYCPATLNGGWIDRLDEDDRPMSTTMPASSLYHLLFALHETTAPI